LQQEIQNAHRLGCHHVCTARGGPGNVAASVGFEGDVKIWRCANNTSNSNTEWALWWAIPPTKAGSGEPWAVALSADENYLACTTHDGCIHVWDISSRERIQTYETGSNTGDGSFAMAVDLSQDGKFTASGHESGAVFVFNNDAGRMAYSLSGKGLTSRRAMAGSPSLVLRCCCLFISNAIVQDWHRPSGQSPFPLDAHSSQRPVMPVSLLSTT